MEKIPTLFLRNPDDMSRVLPEVNPEAAWLLDDSGAVATVKKDGTNILVVSREIASGSRYEYKLKKRKNPSRKEKEAARKQGLPVPEPTYIQARREDPADKHIFRAFDEHYANYDFPFTGEGEYPAEALGRKIQGGVEGEEYRLYFFTIEPEVLGGVEPDYDFLLEYLSEINVEGIVWHGSDERKCKIKKRDFGLPWPVKRFSSQLERSGE